MRPSQGISILAMSLLILISTEEVYGKRILIVTPTPSYSHQIVFNSIALALNKRGHEVVLATVEPINDSTLKNFTEIDFRHLYPYIKKVTKLARYGRSTQTEAEKAVWTCIKEISYMVYSNTHMRKLYAPESNEKFDAVMVESVLGPSLFALAYRFNAPLIGLMSVDLHRWHHYMYAQPILPSHPSNWEQYGDTGYNLPFWKRLTNFIDAWLYIYRWQNYVVPAHHKVATGFLGKDLPYINDIAKNMSIFLVDQPRSIMPARVTQPNIVFFDGVHIAKIPPPLPNAMKEFLDNATDGFIYMSLGTNMRCEDMTMDTLNIIFEAFSKLPYRVLWKCEREQLPRKLGNLLIAKWVPQQGVLAHPNIKLFIFQGGLQSTEETIHYAVPVVGLPLMFDQGSRIHQLVSLGVGRTLDYNTMTAESFYNAIHDVSTDKRYKEKMAKLSALTKDRPYNSLDNIVWWVEFVMRHKGAAHLRFSGMDEPWYKHQDTDIVAFIAIALFVIILVSVAVCFHCVKHLRGIVSAVSENLFIPAEDTKKKQ